MLRPDGQRFDQYLAEKIRGDEVESSADLSLQNVAGRKLDVTDAVSAAITFGCGAGEGIVVDREHSVRAEIAAGDGQYAAAGASIQHRPTRRQLTGCLFQEPQTHRRGGVVARAESGLGRNNESSRGDASWRPLA